MGDNIFNITTEKELDILLKSYKCCILKASADWCGPCKVIEPLFNELTDGFDSSNKFCIIKVDYDKGIQIKRKLKIKSIPYIASFIDGELTDIVNTSNKETIKKFFYKTYGRL